MEVFIWANLKVKKFKISTKTFTQNAGLENWNAMFIPTNKVVIRMIITGKNIFRGHFRLIDSFPIEMQVSIMHIATLPAIVECIIFIFYLYSDIILLDTSRRFQHFYILYRELEAFLNDFRWQKLFISTKYICMSDH